MNNVPYDAAGHQQVVNGNMLSYDAENRPLQAYDNCWKIQTTYAYDGDGHRVRKFGPGGATVYVYDALGQLAAEYATTPPSAPCTTCYLSYDHLGSVRVVTDQAGNVVARHDYLPFGEEIYAGEAGRDGSFGAMDSTRQRFTGQARDGDTTPNLDYFQARYYSGEQGRFLSPDSPLIGADPKDPQSWNLYSYVRNRPLNATDPTGHYVVDCAWDGCPGLHNGGGEGGGLPIVDGVQQTIQVGTLGGNAVAACPNNFCNGWVNNQKGGANYLQYSADANGNGTYTSLATAPSPLTAAQKAYSAYLIDCAHSSVSCNGTNTVIERKQGPTGNYRTLGTSIDPSSMGGMVLDPLVWLPLPEIVKQYFHPSDSWYNWAPFKTTHVATWDNSVETHWDTFNPVYAAPLHFIFDVIPSFFVNRSPGRDVAQFSCSTGGCISIP